MIIDYLECLLDIENRCLKFKKSVLKNFFTGEKGDQKDEVDTMDTYFCYTPRYQDNFDSLCLEQANSALNIRS